LVESRQSSAVGHRKSKAFTLVEMLIAMAITLVMVGAVVTLFANISNSIRNRRAVVELSGQMRHARNMLQQDLQGATCNGLVWQRPDENQGYIEIIEGPRREGQASLLVDTVEEPDPTSPDYNPEIDHTTSILPASNVPFTDDPNQRDWHTDGGSLGDGDDILMLTVRNEHEPFVGRVPLADGTTTAVRPNTDNPRLFVQWQPTTATSPLAEVVWYAVENPHEDGNVDNFFGEPGMRTIYRRALLIAPWLNPYRAVDNNGNFVDTFQLDGAGPTFTAQPGLLRILSDNIENADADDRAAALASLIAFQEMFDISARLEWDPLMGSDGRWKIVANTLGDLTKRENRYEHHFFRHDSGREYPFAVASTGSEYEGTDVAIVTDPDFDPPAYPMPTPADVDAVLRDDTFDDSVADYVINAPDTPNGPYHLRPLVYVAEDSITVATTRAMLNDEGKIVRVVHGLVPLSKERRGEDVMLTDALGFDLRVYDPGAPLFAHRVTETILEPTDPAWLNAYLHDDNTSGVNSLIGNGNADPSPDFPFVGQGAYVDLGYGYNELGKNLTPPINNPYLPTPRFANAFTSSTIPWFFTRRTLGDVYGDQLAPGYAVFDTWSFHYENNGVNEDRYRLVGSTWQDADALTDEGTNGLDDPGHYFNPDGTPIIPLPTRLGPDDVGERETAPPYDKPLRGIQAVLRLYERDSRQVRQVSVNQSFVPE
jgi:prepilin-type N-terminal cleavage/methylation domain-containing protein